MADNPRRGFAAMDPAKQREIASKGGRAAHEKGTAHEFTSDEAREAGRKGGQVVSRDRQHMSNIGREGGLSSRLGNRRTGARNGGGGNDRDDKDDETTQASPEPAERESRSDDTGAGAEGARP
jgi:general stress protein YciG